MENNAYIYPVLKSMKEDLNFLFAPLKTLDKTRKDGPLSGLLYTGEYLVTTDGRRCHVLHVPGLFPCPAGLYNVNSSKDNFILSPHNCSADQFPPWQNVIPLKRLTETPKSPDFFHVDMRILPASHAISRAKTFIDRSWAQENYYLNYEFMVPLAGDEYFFVSPPETGQTFFVNLDMTRFGTICGIKF